MWRFWQQKGSPYQAEAKDIPGEQAKMGKREPHQ